MRSICSLLLGLTALCVSNTVLAERVVSIGGTVTEIIYLLGEESRLVATDTSSIYPAATQTLPKVGYQRTLSAEGVLAQSPETLLITPATGPAKVVSQLNDMALNVVMIDAPDTQAGIASKIQQVADALNVSDKGQQAVSELTHRFAGLSTPQSWPRAPRILFVLQMNGAPMVAGRDTAPAALIGMSGAENVAGDIQGYKALTPEALLVASPDVILVTDQGLDRSGGASAIWSIPGMAATPAAQSQTLVHLDALLALGMGPRTPDAIAQLHRQLADWVPHRE